VAAQTQTQSPTPLVQQLEWQARSLRLLQLVAALSQTQSPMPNPLLLVPLLARQLRWLR